jgi:hypothetical protein
MFPVPATSRSDGASAAMLAIDEVAKGDPAAELAKPSRADRRDDLAGARELIGTPKRSITFPTSGQPHPLRLRVG